MATHGTDIAPATRTADWDRLDARLRGDVIRPGDPRYDQARQLQQMEFDEIAPLAVAYCETAGDVQACIRFAQDHVLPVRTRSGGHSHNGWSTGEALIIDVSRINQVTAGRRHVRLGAGTRAVDALAALRPLGRQIVTGTFPTVAVGGFLTGGGLGWQTRRHGTGSDRIVSARVVLADGRVVRCSADEEPDLYWALRGGGGGFGVVVDFEVRPIDAPTLIRYDTTWPIGSAGRLLAAWQAWCADAPGELGSSLVVLPRFGPEGSECVRIWGVHQGTAAELGRLLDELAGRAGTAPVTTEVGEAEPYSEAMHRSLCGGASVAQCHRTGTGPEAEGHRHPRTLRTYRLTGRPMSVAEATAAVDAWEPGLDQERYLLCIAVGGAANQTGRAETAYVHRDAEFLMGYQYAMRGPRPGDDRMAAAWDWTGRTAATLTPVTSGSYLNFPSTRTEPNQGVAFHGENLPRLIRVRRRYDPDGFFHHPPLPSPPSSAGHRRPTS